MTKSRLLIALTVLPGLLALVVSGVVLANSLGAPSAVVPASPGTAFTYQGVLDDGGTPANGLFDFEAEVFGSEFGVGLIAGPVALGNVAVADGLFTVSLDFGSGVFTGAERWLELAVRPGGGVAAFTTLSPRTELAPVPYAIYADSSASTPWDGLTGMPTDVSDGDNDQLASLSCSVGESTNWNGVAWECSGRSTIAFAGNSETPYGISRVQANGNDLFGFGSPPTGINQQPSISRDGQLIAYAASRFINGAWRYSIFTNHAQGLHKSEILVAPASATLSEPSISPNKLSIAYSHTGLRDIFIAGIDGSNPRNLTNSDGVHEAQPCWADDGTAIYFMGQGGIWSINADGTGQARVTTETNSVSFFVCPRDNGLLLRATRINSFNQDALVHTVNPNDSTETLLGTFPGVSGLSWAPDPGQFLYTSGGSVILHDIGSGTEAKLATVGGAHAVAWSR